MSQFDFTSLQAEIAKQKTLHNKLQMAFSDYVKELAKTSMDSYCKKEVSSAQHSLNAIINSITEQLCKNHKEQYDQAYKQSFQRALTPSGSVKA